VLALVVVNVIWGATFMVSKPLLRDVPPITLAALRFGIAITVLLPILFATDRRPVLNRRATAMAFAGVFVTYVGQNVGLTETSAANGSLIHGGIPVFTAIIATMVLGERLEARRIAGLVLSLAGVAVNVLANGAGPSPEHQQSFVLTQRHPAVPPGNPGDEQRECPIFGNKLAQPTRLRAVPRCIDIEGLTSPSNFASYPIWMLSVLPWHLASAHIARYSGEADRRRRYGRHIRCEDGGRDRGADRAGVGWDHRPSNDCQLHDGREGNTDWKVGRAIIWAGELKGKPC
jgi:uncharacterized membrane protein